ncbi:phage major capsid protein [Bifidobacterium sp. MA2]|uniref:Phage major capsid protein n=1 Tax=Bifidobacterium santillanense TaxID=2809028 RepID=A0ABS5URY7_9BIFI|nr:phage major capsid protein [Bifidobacterium santillanense]MBT1173576.1 phage major capsid protein [Bifidobacterium santillanense]
MALESSKVLLPKEVATVVTKRAKDTSTIAALSPSEPQLFIDKDYMVFTGSSEAEVVAEGEQKTSYEEALTPVVGKRFKVVTTTRVSDELTFADDDAKLQIISHIQDDQAAALGRVLDYVVYHGFDPKKKATLAGFEPLSGQAVQVPATDDIVADLDTLAEAVSDEYDITGIALAKKTAAELRKVRVPSTGQRFYPEVPINLQVGTLDGISAATSGTVNGRLITPDTGIKAFLGDFSLIKWGMVRDIWSEIIRYGDPDQIGKDLKAYNQVAYRTEAIYSYAILDPKGLAVLKTPDTTTTTKAGK